MYILFLLITLSLEDLLINVVLLFLLWELFTPALTDGFSLEFAWQQLYQVSSTLLRSLADVNNAVVWMVSANSSSPFLNPIAHQLHCFTKKLRQAQKYPFIPNLRVLNSNLKSVFTNQL